MSLLVSSARRRTGTGGPSGNIFDGPLPINLHVEGNSISANFYTSIGSLDHHLMAVEPLASSGATHSCSAVSGSDWADIISRGATVDAAWDEGKTNILVLNEHINALYIGTSVATIQTQVTNYLAARLAAHPWRVVYWRTLPYGGSATYWTMNDNMVILDDWMAANASALGIEVVVDPRVAPAFAHDGKDAAPFLAYNDHWQENGPHWVHPNDLGKSKFVPLIVAAMATMPATAP